MTDMTDETPEIARLREENQFLRQVLKLGSLIYDVDPDMLGFAVIVGGYTHVAGMGPMSGQVVHLGEVRFSPYEKGEIVVLLEDHYGPEPYGERRRIVKSDVRAEWFGRDWEGAQRRSAEVKAAPSVDCTAPPPPPSTPGGAP